MIRSLLLLACCLSWFPEIASGHQDFWRISHFGKVRVRFLTGFDYEELNKAVIIGQLAQRLAAAYRYQDSIYLDFRHNYIENCSPAYFLSFDCGATNPPVRNSREHGEFSADVLVLRQISRRFDIAQTLRLLDYGLKNLEGVKANQKRLIYRENYSNWSINSIDTNVLKRIAKMALSGQARDIFRSTVEWPNTRYSTGISYRWADSSFVVSSRNFSEKDTDLLRLRHIYQLERFGDAAMVFDTDSSFFYVDEFNQKQVSNRHVVRDIHGNYRPFRIKSLGGEKFSLHFYVYTQEQRPQPRDRTLLYLADKDKLIQDLDSLLE